MFNKKLLRVCSIFLALLVCCNIFASAVGPRASSRIGFATVSLSKDRYGYLWVDFSIRTNGVMDVIGASSIRIERYSGSKWVEEDTLKNGDITGLLANDLSVYDAEIPYSPLYSDASYRAIVCFYAKDSEGSSTKNVTSNLV